jgi:hypothetical protein
VEAFQIHPHQPAQTGQVRPLLAIRPLAIVFGLIAIQVERWAEQYLRVALLVDQTALGAHVPPGTISVSRAELLQGNTSPPQPRSAAFTLAPLLPLLVAVRALVGDVVGIGAKAAEISATRSA